MDYKKLQEMGAIVPQTLLKRDIEVTYRPMKPEAEWQEAGNPEFATDEVTEVYTVYIRLPSAADALEIATASDRDRPFVGIYRCWRNEDGSEVLPSLEAATSMRPWLALPLWDAINSVSPSQRKKSQPRTSSGASSRSASAVKQQANSKKK